MGVARASDFATNIRRLTEWDAPNRDTHRGLG